MYRQRKRDLNLKPNRQLDKRSSRGMIYENEELRMRTIAICEDVDRGQNDIKKLRKENDHLKREIWGLRDECEKLEEMLKKVCISANIPEIMLESSSKENESDDDDDDDDEDDEDHERSPPEDGDDRRRNKKSRRKRRESGTSVLTFDSEVGSCMTSMFGDDDQQQQQYQQQHQEREDICFADDDPGSVIMNPEMMAMPKPMPPPPGQAPLATPEPEPGPSSAMLETATSAPVFHPHPSWSHPTAMPPDLEAVREESESIITSALSQPPGPMPNLTAQAGVNQGEGEGVVDDMLPDPNLVVLTNESQNEGMLELEGRKTPVIQITPASSPNSNNSSADTQPLPENSGLPSGAPNDQQSTEPGNQEDGAQTQTYGCVTVVPKTFKVTSEILVGSGDTPSPSADDRQTNPFVECKSRSVELPRKGILTKKPDSDPTIATADQSDQIMMAGGGGGIYHRRSSYFPSNSATIPQTPIANNAPSHSRGFGVLGSLGYCCCNSDMMLGGYQSEPSLTSPGGFVSSEEPVNFFNPFCCRGAPLATPPVTMRSAWNTVDRNIVIGFYGYSTASAGGTGQDGEHNNGEPKVQEIIDELEAQFDPTLENILGIRIIPGRIFISLKNASVLKAFLAHFKNDLLLHRTKRKIRIHFIEGASAKLSTTLVLSGIPTEIPDLSIITALNQFGQVVAPLEKRNYKGVDISERIAKMHLVCNESSIPETVNVSGFEVRIRVEPKSKSEIEHQLHETQNILTYSQQGGEGMEQNQQKSLPPPRKYGFVPPAAATSFTPTTTTTLKPHKPVTRSSSSAPRLETQTPAPGQVTQPFPSVEQRRQSSVCTGNIPPDQHPSKLTESGKAPQQLPQQKVTMSLSPGQDKSQQQASSTPNLQPPAKKPLARLLVSSPGSFSPTSPPVGSPFDNSSPTGQGQHGQGGTVFKQFCRSIDPRRGSPFDKGHAPLTPSSSYSPRTRRKSSVQFASHVGKGKREPLPWCGCWGLGCS